MEDQKDFLHTEEPSAPPLQQTVCMERKAVADLPQGKVVGASLLCFCVDPTWSRPYFLLGKERRNVRWPAGSERWSDFGGRTKSKSDSPEDTAAREFVEESLAMVRYFDRDTLPRTQYVDIADSLRTGDFTFQLTIGFGTQERPRSYVTFVKQIPWDPQALLRFDECRDMLLNPNLHFRSVRWKALVDHNPGVRQVQQKETVTEEEEILAVANTKSSDEEENPVKTVVQVKKDFLEKKVLGLWSIPQLQNAVECNGIMFRRDGRVERCRPSFTSVMELVLSELAFYEPETMHENCYSV